MNYKKWSDESVNFDERYSSNSNISRIPVFGTYLQQNLHERMNRALLFLKRLKAKRIIDLGCGVGRFATEAASMGIEVYGYDISEDAIIMAEEKAKSLGLEKNCFFFHADITQVDFPAVDAWFELGCLQYLSNPKEVMDKLVHINHCFSCLPRKGHWLGFPRFFYRSMFKQTPYKTYTKTEIQNLFEAYENLFIDKFRASYYISTL